MNNEITWRVGCSGLYYPEWKGKFYPEKLAKSKWLEFYCMSFNTLELNVTFYRYPNIETLRSWYQRSPAGFRFSVKVPRQITHYKRLRNTQEQLKSFYDNIASGLAEKLGCVLFQLSPVMPYSTENLNLVLSAADGQFKNVFEFRHASWWNPEVYNALDRAGIIFCNISHPSLPDKIIESPGASYFRFHGVPALYQSAYKLSELTQVYSDLSDSQGLREAYVYFNNTASGAAVDNARAFQKLAGQPVDVDRIASP